MVKGTAGCKIQLQPSPLLSWKMRVLAAPTLYGVQYTNKTMRTERPGGLQSKGWQRVGHDLGTEHAHTNTHTHTGSQSTEASEHSLKL